MGSVAVVTDSNSGILKDNAAKLGVYVIPTPCIIDGEVHLEGVDLTLDEFFDRLAADADITTSQPSPGDIQDMFEELLKEYDEVVFIPISSGLSGSCSTANMIAEDYDGRVHVVNNQRVSVTQRQSVLDAKALAAKGYTGAQIKEILERDKYQSSIYISLETLKYLKKGGRITPAAAAIGTLLKLNPVLQIQGDKLDAYAKARGKAAAKKLMLKAMENDMNTRFKDAYEKGNVYIEVAYTGDITEAQEWADTVKAAYPNLEFNMDPLSASVSTHIGTGALAIACSVKLPELLD